MQATPAITMATVATRTLKAATLATIERLSNQSTVEVPAALKAGGHWSTPAAMYTDMEQHRCRLAGRPAARTASADVWISLAERPAFEDYESGSASYAEGALRRLADRLRERRRPAYGA